MTHWSATVDYPGAVTEEESRALLAGGFTAATMQDGRTSLSFGVEAADLGQATEAAIRQARRFTDGIVGRPPIGLHIVPGVPSTTEDQPRDPDLVDAAARVLLGGISQQGLVRLQQTAGFPQPVQRFGGGRGVWVKSSIEAYLRASRQ
jgi:hypothetical protein